MTPALHRPATGGKRETDGTVKAGSEKTDMPRWAERTPLGACLYTAGSHPALTMQRLTWRERLGEWLADYPLLRTLVLNPWFTLLFFLVLFLGVGAALCLPKIWVATPPDFTPVVRISLLDRIQARSLRSSAARHAAAGRDREAALAWQGAVVNDPGNLEVYRALFRHLAQTPALPLSQVNRAFRSVGWFLELAKTNRTDLELAALAMDRYGLSEDVYNLLSPLADELPRSLEAAYLKALFLVGRYAEFNRRWVRLEGPPPEDPELGLCRAAYLAGWGPAGESAAHWEELRRTRSDPRLGIYAARLELIVSEQRQDVAAYTETLQHLSDRSLDRLVDHTRYWRLLRATGQGERARHLALEFNRPPDSAQDVVHMAETLLAVGLEREALEYVQRYATPFGSVGGVWSVALWATYADLLISRRDWEGLHELARHLWAIPGAQPVLGGFSRFLSGRAAHEQGARDAARGAFAEAVQLGFPPGRVGIRAAGQLLQMGYPELAWQALQPLEARFRNEPAYWRVYFNVVFTLRLDDALLLRAAARAHELEPESAEWKFNYAAALLIGRRRPELALALTRDLLEPEGPTPGGLINHAIALALNRRFAEAAALLNRLDPESLTVPLREVYHLAWLEIHYETGDWDHARADLVEVETARLFPCQQRRLDEIRQALAAADRADQRASTSQP